MAQLYGGRWRVIGDLGHGGQSNVFRVVDVISSENQEYALKRVVNPKRRDRFNKEVEAIRRLKHPNIIPLVDHSALEALDDLAKMYIVTPVAENGDLSSRAALYKLSVDSTLQVAKQLSSALAHAHDAGIVHRDVKPANILFPSVDHDCWLADFGICLIREEPRVTADSEAVGPWSFMAPELEGGGQLEVQNAADIYSLGKVIYFMISGGRILPRERINEPEYASVFSMGERYRLLHILLARMICPLESRLKSMGEVSAELAHIAEWELKANASPLSPAARAAADRLKKEQLETIAAREQSKVVRENEESVLKNVAQSFTDWLRVRLETACGSINVPDILSCRTTDVGDPSAFRFELGMSQFYVGVGGIELLLEKPQETFKKTHGLLLLLLQHRKIMFWSGDREPTLPARDLQLAFLPYYVQHANQSQSQNMFRGFLVSKANARSPQRGISWVTGSYIGDAYNIFYSFVASKWPSVIDQLELRLEEAIEVFLDFIEKGANRIG